MHTDTQQWTAPEVARLLATVETERRYYQEIVASIPVPLLLVGSEMEVVCANGACRSLLGLKGNTAGLPALERFFPADALALIRNTTLTGEPADGVTVSLVGGKRSVRLYSRPIRSWEDLPGCEALVTLEEQAGTHEPELHDLLDAVVWEADLPEKRFVYVSSAGRELLGYPLESWTGTADFWSERIHPEDRGWVLQSYERAIDNGQRHVCEYRSVRADGQVIWIRESARVIEPEDRPSKLVGYSTDVTERRLIEMQFVQAQRIEAATKLERHLAGFDQEAPAPPSIPIDARRLLIRIAPDLQKMLGQSIGLELSLADGPVIVRAEAEALEHTITALVERAQACISGTGTVTIQCFPAELEENLELPGASLRAGAYGSITIEDDGESFTPDARASLFEPPSNLATLHSRVTTWGGDMAVSIRSPRGTVFQIFLPWTGEPLSGPVTTGARVKAVLLMEKETGLRTLVKKALLRHEYVVVEAESFEQAAKHCREHPDAFDLLIADATLPDAENPCSDLKVLYVGSGEHGPAFPPQAAFLHKPFTLGQLLDKVREMTV